jgi:membrane protease subunit (stomatin/prohibitin family)
MAPQVIEFLDDSGEIMISRVPPQGSGEFMAGSQLVVQESQVAVFFRDGQMLDVFQAGRHTLATQNLPLLSRLIVGAFKGKSPFRAYVYFVALKTFVNLGWGTASPVLFRDSDFRMVSLRAHGAFSIRITQPRVFLNTLVGTRGLETTYALEEFLRTIIVSRLNTVLGQRMKSILDLPVEYSHIAVDTKEAVHADFGQYGIELIDLLVEAITVPPDVQQMINKATGVAAQDADKYRTIAMSDALRSAAENPGQTGGAMGAGMGLGVGLGMARAMADELTGFNKTPPAAGAAPAAARLSAADVKAKLQQLKDFKAEGLITDADYEEQKRRILGQM